ncbi:MAG: hypothetical protein KatS3mg108_0252 [Isosphaeraceae bacterium]|nr:MAG: hypothetical protein KatS3mg108_0252 [Isosphaeraceae bacterium]
MRGIASEPSGLAGWGQGRGRGLGSWLLGGLVRQRRRVARWLILAAAIAFLANWGRVILRPVGDFALHWRFGDRFLRRAFLYEGGMHTPYPPTWAMASSVLTVGPFPVVRAVLYPFGLVPLVVLLGILDRMTRGRWPLDRERSVWAAGLGVLLASRFVIRELPECGANLMIVGLAWAGVYLWWRGREVVGAAALGLSMALKCTPALFLGYLAWKRQWRMLGLSGVAALGFFVLPAVWMGWGSYADHVRYWMGHAAKGLTEASPIWGVLNDEKLQNVSLRPALGRLLVEAPVGHASYLDHPLRVRALGLDPVWAGWVVKVALVLLVAGVALGMGRRVDRSDGAWVAYEAAAVSLLMLLVSPITWRQHCVAAVPAGYLIAREWLAGRGPDRWPMRLLGVYVVLVLVLDRGLIGKPLTDVLDSYGATTWGLLALLAVVMGQRARLVGCGEAKEGVCRVDGAHATALGNARHPGRVAGVLGVALRRERGHEPGRPGAGGAGSGWGRWGTWLGCCKSLFPGS